MKNRFLSLKVKSTELLSPNRFDLAIKLIFLESRFEKSGFAFDLYKNHLQIFGLGQIKEPGNLSKNNLNVFIETFKRIDFDIKEKNFDFKKSPIPISSSNTITNGSHRTAAAIFYNKSVQVTKEIFPKHIYDYKFFKKGGMSQDQLDFVTLTYIKYCTNPRIAIIWPCGNDFNVNIEKYFDKIIYEKEFKVNQKLIQQIVEVAYKDEKWLGDKRKLSSGSAHKASMVSGKSNKVHIIVFETNNNTDVNLIKTKFRGATSKDKHSIHITDNKKETIWLSKMVLNENSIDFMKNRIFNDFHIFNKLFSKFKKEAKYLNINLDLIAITSSASISAYGVRDCKDIDYISLNHILNFSEKKISTHEHQLYWYLTNKKDLLFNPKNYFYFDGIKFITISRIVEMKKNRNEIKDINDLKLMKKFKLMKKKLFYNQGISLKIKAYFLLLRIFYSLREIIFKLLKTVKIYKFIRSLYRKIR